MQYKAAERGFKGMKKFIFYWIDGKVEESTGLNVADAFAKLGYGSGAIRTLDYYKEVEIDDQD